MFLVACTFDPGNPPNNGRQDSGIISEPGVKPFSSSRTFPTTGFSGCGDEAISCNCNYTSAVPGVVTPTRLCNSGYHRFLRCQGFCPGGGTPWATVCEC